MMGGIRCRPIFRPSAARVLIFAQNQSGGQLAVRQASSPGGAVDPPQRANGRRGLGTYFAIRVGKHSIRTLWDDRGIMEHLQDIQLTIPVAHMVLFIALISFSMLFARYKLGLSITFCFTFYWGFIYNKDVFFTTFEGSSPFLFLYFFSGFLLLLFALFSFVSED